MSIEGTSFSNLVHGGGKYSGDASNCSDLFSVIIAIFLSG